MPAFIHNRAEHILAKNPSMSKSMAFALATQQSHVLGKSPKGYGTSEGKVEAKKKYDSPKKDYKKTANPGGLKSPKMEKGAMLNNVMMSAFRDEVGEIAKEGGLKDILLREIPGTKPWLINPQVAGSSVRPPGGGALKAMTKKRTGQLPGGAWDVSHQAKAMGVT